MSVCRLQRCLRLQGPRFFACLEAGPEEESLKEREVNSCHSACVFPAASAQPHSADLSTGLLAPSLVRGWSWPSSRTVRFPDTWRAGNYPVITLFIASLRVTTFWQAFLWDGPSLAQVSPAGNEAGRLLARRLSTQRGSL